MPPKHYAHNVYHVFASSSNDPLLPCALGDDAPKPPPKQQLWREESKIFKAVQGRQRTLSRRVRGWAG